MKSDGSIIIDTKILDDGMEKGFEALKNGMDSVGVTAEKVGKAIKFSFSEADLTKPIAAAADKVRDLERELSEVTSQFDVALKYDDDKEAARLGKKRESVYKQLETARRRLTRTIAQEARKESEAERKEAERTTRAKQKEAEKQAKAAMRPIKRFGTRLGSIVSGALLFNLISSGLREVTKYFGNALKSNEEFTQSFGQLKGALLTAFQPIYEVVAPAIVKLMDVLTAAIHVIGQFFAALSGKSYADISKNAEALYDEANAINGVGSAAKKAQKQLAGFDQISKLGSKEESDGTSSDVSPSFGAENVTSQVSSMISTVKNLFAGLVNEFKTRFSPAISSWGSAFPSVIPSVVGAVDRIKTSFSDLWSNSLAPTLSYIVSDFIPSIANSYSRTFAPIFADIMPVAIETWTTDFENSTLLISKYCGWLQEYFGKVKMVFSDMCKSISSNWKEYGGSLLQGFTDFKNGLWETFWYIYDNIIDPVFSYISQTFDSLWTKHLAPLWDSIVDFVLSVSDNIMLLWNKTLKPIVDWIGIRLMPLITAIWVGVVDAVNIVVSWVSDAVRSVINYLKGVIDFVVGVFTLDFEKAWNGIKEMFSAVWLSIENTFKGVINAIIWAINQLVAACYQAVASTVNGLGHVVSGIGKLLGKDDWGFSLPNTPPKIPYLAQGAVIPPNAPFMAVLGDQKNGTNIEAPLSTIQEAVAMVMQDQTAAIMAGFASSVEVQREILQAVLGIQIGDDVIASAYDRYRTKLAVQRGG